MNLPSTQHPHNNSAVRDDTQLYSVLLRCTRSGGPSSLTCRFVPPLQGEGRGKVYALSAATGLPVWANPYATGNVVSSSPAVANGVVYVGSYDLSLYALSASTGARLWSYPTGDGVPSSPAVANGVVYVGSVDGSLYAFDLAGGLSASPSKIDPATLHPDHSLKVRR